MCYARIKNRAKIQDEERHGNYMKKKFTFKKFLLLYIAIWLVVTVVVSVKLWDVFADYQTNFDLAKEAANPDLLMPEIMELYKEENIVATAAGVDLGEVSIYEKEEEKEKLLKNMVAGKELTYKRNEGYSDRKPIYDIFADETIIGRVSLKQEQASDSYGFHKCVLQENTVDVKLPELINIQISALAEDTVFVNGKEVNKEMESEQEQEESVMAKEAFAMTGVSNKKTTYCLEGFLTQPLVQIQHQGEKVTLSLNGKSIYEECTADKDLLTDELEDQILAAGEAYIMNTNQLAPFAEVAQYLQSGSKAYQTVQSVQSGLSWAGKPDELEIQNALITNMEKYSENVFTVKTYYKIHRLYREVSYEEDMTYEWLYVKDGNKWRICNFSLANE